MVVVVEGAGVAGAASSARGLQGGCCTGDSKLPARWLSAGWGFECALTLCREGR